MKNNGDPNAMAGKRRLKQIRKQAAAIRGTSGRVRDGAYTILLLEEARKWREQFYSETLGTSSGSSNA